LVTIATGFAAGATAAFIADAGAARVGMTTPVVCVPAALTAAFVTGPGAVLVGAATPVVCVPTALAADTDGVPAAVGAGAQGTVLAAVGAAGAAAFFFPKSDPKLEIAAVAFETAVLAPAGI
jgi:hypothetical protein